jgi:hypothetical protein
MKNLRTLLTVAFALGVAPRAFAYGEDFSLTCESQDYRPASCGAGTGIDEVRLERQLSNSSCDEGSSWGYDGGSVWVNNGCRAVFRVTPSRRRLSQTSLTCESTGYRYNTCSVSGRIDDVSLTQQRSKASCSGHWGYTDDSIWVDEGCRASFTVTYRDRW